MRKRGHGAHAKGMLTNMRPVCVGVKTFTVKKGTSSYAKSSTGMHSGRALLGRTNGIFLVLYKSKRPIL
eukprot:1158566-Pelagomonas_calceolata.AAC.11